MAATSNHLSALSIGLLIANHTPLPSGGTLEWSTKVADVLPQWRLTDRYASEHMEILDLLSSFPFSSVESDRSHAFWFAWP